MLTFTDVGAFAAEFGDAVRWRRVVAAIARAEDALPEVTLSLGASLTYRVTRSPDADVLTGHRRYQELRYVVEGRLVLETAPVVNLLPSDEYSDLTDRQHFAGTGPTHELTAGQLAVIGVDEAVRDVLVDGRVMVLRVTVEGAG